MADDLAPRLRDWRMEICEHYTADICSPCLRDHILASDWLAAHDAEVAEKARADERERIAAAIEARGVQIEAEGRITPYRDGLIDGTMRAARIARTPDPNGDNT